MHGIIPKLFDCWAGPVAHLLLLKSSMFILFDITIRLSITVRLTCCLDGLDLTKQVKRLLICKAADYKQTNRRSAVQ